MELRVGVEREGVRVHFRDDPDKLADGLGRVHRDDVCWWTGETIVGESAIEGFGRIRLETQACQSR